jgi:hypothetical protein
MYPLVNTLHNVYDDNHEHPRLRLRERDGDNWMHFYSGHKLTALNNRAGELGETVTSYLLDQQLEDYLERC